MSGFKSLLRALGKDMEMLEGGAGRRQPIESLPLASQGTDSSQHLRCIRVSPLALSPQLKVS